MSLAIPVGKDDHVLGPADAPPCLPWNNDVDGLDPDQLIDSRRRL